MKKLVTVTNETILDDLRSKPDITLVFPLKSFCVGYPLEFEVSDITDFVLVNRILDDFDLDKLASLLNGDNIKGIIFDDLGIIDIVKDLDIEKILLLDHLDNKTKYIKYYLEYVYSVVVSNDLTEKEIRDIAAYANKPLVVNVFGLKTLMYSRRLLLSNYHEYYNLEKKTILNANIDDKGFKIVENSYGTKFYTEKYYDAFKLLDLKNVLYFWYEPLFLDNAKIKQVVLNNDLTGIPSDELFLNLATFYKVGGE